MRPLDIFRRWIDIKASERIRKKRFMLIIYESWISMNISEHFVSCLCDIIFNLWYTLSNIFWVKFTIDCLLSLSSVNHVQHHSIMKAVYSAWIKLKDLLSGYHNYKRMKFYSDVLSDECSNALINTVLYACKQFLPAVIFRIYHHIDSFISSSI